MTLYQLENGYRYNSDTLFLYDFIASGKVFGDVLDVGCGCGILGILLARDFKINLNLIDIQEINLELTRQNLKLNNIQANAILGDFAEFKFDTKFDLIVSNPPFYDEKTKKSEISHIKTSRYNQFLPLKKLLESANSILKPRGVFAFCYDIGRFMEILVELQRLKLNLIEFQPLYPNLTKPAKIGLFKVQKSSKSPCLFRQPIFAFEGENHSQKALEIFKKADILSKDFK